MNSKKLTKCSLLNSDVVETVTSETWLKLRDRDFAMKVKTETWKFETRDLACL